MPKKPMQKFSKATIGQTVETVSDYVDIMSQLVVEYFNQRYKIEKKVEDVKRATLNTLYALKKQFIRTVVETLFLVTGILALIVGIMMILNKVLPLEYVFIGYGLIVTIAIVLTMKVKA